MTKLEASLNSQIGTLVKSIKVIIDHHSEVEKIKGERFNIFSILGLESKENQTHSSFIGELLNPEGAHSKGNIFLQHFLKAINYNVNDTHFDISTARVLLEKHIGNRNDEDEIGGRIDIYITDGQGNFISIENKIYASDQHKQILRYVNHKKDKNTVYYLTLEGTEASEVSRGKLMANKDYYAISYRSEIIQWLENCIKEAADEPILRETIKQYLILIKKLTNQLTNNKMEKEVYDIIKRNYEASVAITSNLWKVELKAAHEFLTTVKKYLNSSLKEEDGWNIHVDEDLNVAWTGITITKPTWKGIYVKLEGNSKLPWQNSHYGITADKDVFDRDDLKSKFSTHNLFKEDFKESHHWPYYRKINLFGKVENKVKLFDPEKKALLVHDVSTKLLEVARICETPLENISKVKMKIER